MPEQPIATIPTSAQGAVLLQRTRFRGRERLDVRYHYRAEGGDLQPTRKGISLPIDQLPQLLAGLHEIEADAIASGDLLPEDYENAGVPVPEALRGEG